MRLLSGEPHYQQKIFYPPEYDFYQGISPEKQLIGLVLSSN